MMAWIGRMRDGLKHVLKNTGENKYTVSHLYVM